MNGCSRVRKQFVELVNFVISGIKKCELQHLCVVYLKSWFFFFPD